MSDLAGLQRRLKKLTGTDLEAAGAANLLAGTKGMELVGALNVWAGRSRPYLELEGILRYIMGVGVGEPLDLSSLSVGLKLPGTAGNYASSPDSVLHPTGDVDIRVCAKADDWTPAVANDLIAKWGVAGGTNRAFLVNISSTGFVNLFFAQDGTTALQRTSSTAVPFADGATGWIRVTLDVDNGAGQHVVSFFTSTDGLTWAALGTPVTTSGVVNVFDATTAVMLGTDGNVARYFAGTIYYAEIRTGIDGPVVAKFDASTVTPSGTQTPATFDTTFRNNGDQTDTTTTWTVNGTGWSWEGASFAGAPTVALSLPGTSGNYASQPDSAGNSVVGDIDIRAKVAADDWTPSAVQTLVAKWGATASYLLRLQTDGSLGFFYDPTGAAGDFSNPLGFTDGTTNWVRVTLDIDNGAAGRTTTFYTSTDGITWTVNRTVTTAGVAAALTDTAEVVAIGSDSNNTNLFDGTVHYAEVRNGIDGPIVARFDPTAIARTGTRTPTTTVQPGGTPNLISPNSASVETDATGWAVETNATIARSTAQFLDGAASLAITALATGASAARTNPLTTAPVVAGKLYTATLSMRAATVARTCLARIDWYTAASVFISTSSGTGATDSTTAWTAYTVSAVAPATAAYGVVVASVNDAAQLLTEVHYVDRVSLVESAATWTMNGAAWDLVKVT